MERKQKVRIFRQNETMETCLCCCVLMIFDYYRMLPEDRPYPTRKMEERLYRYVGYHAECGRHSAAGQRGAPLSAAAYLCSAKGLAVTLYHSEPEYMDNYRSGTPYYPEETFPDILERYRYWMERGKGEIACERCTRLTCELLARLLDRQMLIVAACAASDGQKKVVLHAVLIDSWKETTEGIRFHICDPANGRYELDGEELLEYMDTPVGIQFMTVSNYSGQAESLADEAVRM